MNGQLFKALLSKVDETIRTTQTAASGRNGMDLGLLPSKRPSMPSKKRLIYTNPALNRLAASEAATLRMIATLLKLP